MDGTRCHHDAMNDRPYRTATEVALELGVSLRTVRRWVADGRLRATRVGRSVRIPVDAYREASLPSFASAVPGIESRSPASWRVGEVAADYSGGRAAATWPDTPERLAEQRRHAAALMDRLAARGRPGSGPSDTADAILDAVREEFGAAGVLRLPGAERAGRPAAGRPGRRPTR
jgi:excisionase family DNA binding protein